MEKEIIGFVDHLLWQIKKKKKAGGWGDEKERERGEGRRDLCFIKFYLVLFTCFPPLLIFEPFMRPGKFQPLSLSLFFHDLSLVYPEF